MNELSKTDLYFLSLVLSGALELEKIEPEYRSKDGTQLFYVPERLAIARNLKTLEEFHMAVAHLVALIESGQDPVAEIERD